MLGFTEREIGHMTFKKWKLLYEHFQRYHNFKTQGNIFRVQREQKQTSEQWIPD